MLFSSHTGEDHFSSSPFMFSFAFDVVLGGLGHAWKVLRHRAPLLAETTFANIFGENLSACRREEFKESH